MHTINFFGVELTEKFVFAIHIKHLTIKAKQSVMHYGSTDRMVYWVAAYLMLYAPLQLARRFVAHLYGYQMVGPFVGLHGCSLLRSEGLLTESPGSWYA